MHPSIPCSLQVKSCPSVQSTKFVIIASDGRPLYTEEGRDLTDPLHHKLIGDITPETKTGPQVSFFWARLLKGKDRSGRALGRG
jgi:hypothetical protein